MKKTKKQPKIIYYENELTDDFAGTKIKTKTIDAKFKFVHKNPIWKFFSFLIYYIVAIPIVWVYEKVFLQVKFTNKKAVKKLKGKTYFMYGNHTGFIDAFTPNLISFPKRNRIVVSEDTVSIKGLKNIVQMLGALPVPSGSSGMKQYLRAVKHYNKTCNITIYPEAHIWPYYTGVRNFKDSSFAYPIESNSPVVAFFTAYSEPKGFLKFLRKANVQVFVSDPIYPDITKPRKEAQKELRDKVFEFMKDCSQNYSKYSVIEYKHISEKQEDR